MTETKTRKIERRMEEMRKEENCGWDICWYATCGCENSKCKEHFFCFCNGNYHNCRDYHEANSLDSGDEE